MRVTKRKLRKLAILEPHKMVTFYGESRLKGGTQMTFEIVTTLENAAELTQVYKRNIEIY